MSNKASMSKTAIFEAASRQIEHQAENLARLLEITIASGRVVSPEEQDIFLSMQADIANLMIFIEGPAAAVADQPRDAAERTRKPGTKADILAHREAWIAAHNGSVRGWQYAAMVDFGFKTRDTLMKRISE